MIANLLKALRPSKRDQSFELVDQYEVYDPKSIDSETKHCSVMAEGTFEDCNNWIIESLKNSNKRYLIRPTGKRLRVEL